MLKGEAVSFECDIVYYVNVIFELGVGFRL